MSYYANGSGTINLCCAAEEIPSDVLAELNEVIDAYAYGPELDLHFDGKYYEYEVFDALDKIKEYAVGGSIEFHGENYCFWRIFFDEEKKEWTECSGVRFWDLSDLGLTVEEITFLKKAIEQAEGPQSLKDGLTGKLGIAADSSNMSGK